MHLLARKYNFWWNLGLRYGILTLEQGDDLMTHNLSERIESDLISLAAQYGLDKVILFGSRARGDNQERSDIDLAIQGGDTTRFALDVDDKVWTLLLFDIVDLGKPVQPELLREIEKDGVVLYEKV